MTTLAEIAREMGVTPQAVGRWRKLAEQQYGQLDYQQLGNKKDYTPDAVNKIMEFRPEQPEPAPGTPEIHTGNHRVTGQLAPLPSAADLGTFRGDAELTTFDDPLAVVDQALDFADALITAIDDDADYQTQQIQQTQRANAKLKDKLDQVQRRKDRYQTESRMMALLQSQQATELQQNMQALQQLGQPNTSGGE
ncbi:MAG: hypothetical protein AAFR42_21070 [Cyanobacteria bacterium J06628_6]